MVGNPWRRRSVDSTLVNLNTFENVAEEETQNSELAERLDESSSPLLQYTYGDPSPCPRSKKPSLLLQLTRLLQSSAPPTLASLSQHLQRCLYFLVPSFIQSRLRPDQAGHKKLHPTAYLDGMRGVACFMVYLCHFSYQCFVITVGFGQGDQGDNYRIIQLPFIRLAYSGPPAVAIFFVISGYALSYKPIKQMRAKAFDGLLTTLSSSTLRRPIRLFLPCAISTLGVLIMIRLGIYEYTRFVADSNYYLRNMHEGNLGRLPTFTQQFLDWSHKIFHFIAPFSFYDPFAGIIDYDVHLWTIPWEFRASFVLFLSLFAVARMKPWIRITTLLVLVWWVLQWGRWEMLLFWFGTILAEFDQINLESKSSQPYSTRVAMFRECFYIANFACGCYLMSYPDNLAESTPGFVWLESLIPAFWPEKYRFWQAIGAIQTVWATNNVDSLKNIFNGPVIQYFGKISYALYLMHGPVIHSAGYLWLAGCWSVVGMEPRSRYELGFVIGWFFTTITLIWAADIFERMVDKQCVNFARWAETKILARATITDDDAIESFLSAFSYTFEKTKLTQNLKEENLCAKGYSQNDIADTGLQMDVKHDLTRRTKPGKGQSPVKGKAHAT